MPAPPRSPRPSSPPASATSIGGETRRSLLPETAVAPLGTVRPAHNDKTEKGGRPVPVTPIVCRWFGADGTLNDDTALLVNGLGVNHPEVIRSVAAAEDVPLIDLTATTKALVESLGAEGSKAQYLHDETKPNCSPSTWCPGAPCGRDERLGRPDRNRGAPGLDGARSVRGPVRTRFGTNEIRYERERAPMQLPPEDRGPSPRTGYTRAHWEAAADVLLAAVAPYATPDRALYHLPGDHQSWSGRLSDGLEGYARTLLLAAFRRDETVLQRYADGLAAGVSGVWPRIEDRSQPLVEAASIALALRLTRPLLWDRLDDAVRQRAAAWLADALNAEPWPCNWELFPVAVGGFLAETGHEREAAQRAVDRGLARIEDWYAGDGWYTDGDGRKYDYYNGWAMHLYPVLHAWLADDEKLLDLYGGRLERHLADYARLFGGDGAPMHQGRSLTYRFAATAPLWLGVLIGRTPLSPGETRRLASGALKYFLDRGAVDAHGLLTLGWHGPDTAVLQGYSGPASPYWASKGFLGLLLPPDHAVWTATEEPGPVERTDAVTPIAPANWLLQSTRADGVVRLHNHGSEDVRYDPYYTRLGYSTVTAPSASYDNSVLVGDDPSRTRIEPLGVGEGWAASRHAAGAGARVTAVVLVRGAVEVRAFLVSGAEPGTPVRATGWAAPEGLRSELLPAVGLDDTLTGVTGEGPTLFVALSRLTGAVDAEPLEETVTVRAEGERELTVLWSGGPGLRIRWHDSGVDVRHTAEG